MSFVHLLRDAQEVVSRGEIFMMNDARGADDDGMRRNVKVHKRIRRDEDIATNGHTADDGRVQSDDHVPPQTWNACPSSAANSSDRAALEEDDVPFHLHAVIDGYAIRMGEGYTPPPVWRSS